MSDLPDGWEWAPLSSIAEVQLGRQRSPKNHSGPSMRPYLRAANVTWDGLALDDVKEMNFSPTEVETFRLRHGDILLSEASGSASEVGKPAIWKGEIEECCFQNTLLRVRALHVDPAYLLWFFKWLALSGQFAKGSRGVGIHHLGAKALSAWQIPVAPPDGQKSIVAAIEEQFSRLDAATAVLASAHKRIGTLTRSIILTAVPESYPAHWERVTVGEAGQVMLGRQRAPQYHNGPNMRPYLRVANVFEDRIDSGDVMSMHFDEDEFARYKVLPGDILLNEGQSPQMLGRPAMYRGDPPDVAFTNSLLRFRPSPSVMPEWALLVFRRHMHARRFMRESKITTNIAHLSAGRFKNVEFPVPPLDEQKTIATNNQEKLSEAARLSVAVENQLVRTNSLRSSVLSAAFSGKLI